MDSGFVHYEVLGLRRSLDEWLAGIQETGLCHFSDALKDIEGHVGITRPVPKGDELRARLMRSQAAHSLRTVSRVLPASDAGNADDERPRWDLGPGGSDETTVVSLVDEARTHASAIAAGLETLRDAEAAATDAALAHAALGLFPDPEGSAAERPEGALALAVKPGVRGARGLARRLKRAGYQVRRGQIPKATVILALRGSSEPDAELLREARAFGDGLGAMEIALDAYTGSHEAALRAAEEDRARTARIEIEARSALTALTKEHGPRARCLLDSIEDAESREEVWPQLAATDHVVSARVWVPREDRVVFLEGVRQQFGESLVLRPLAPSEDEPTLPRRVAPVPLEALRGLEPARFGTVSASALLALFAPIAVGAVWADVAGGLLMLAVGAMLGFGAGPGSPRRDTSLLAQVGGLFALLTGVLAGRAFGDAGATWFGTDWGLAPGFSLTSGNFAPYLQPFAGVLQILGQVAALVALYGIVLALAAWRREHVARARLRLLTALDALTVAGLACAALGPSSGLFFLWVLAPASALLVLILEGPAGFLRRYVLDQVGVLRLVALPGAALLFFGAAFGILEEATLVEAILLPLTSLFVLVAVITDPAHVAMGVPSGLGLGGRRFTRPYRPLRQRVRGALREAPR